MAGSRSHSDSGTVHDEGTCAASKLKLLPEAQALLGNKHHSAKCQQGANICGRDGWGLLSQPDVGTGRGGSC